MNPFDIVNDVSYAKKYILENEKDYLPFIINTHFSYFTNSIFYANDMNMNYHLDNKMQHDYLFHSLRKEKRKTKWFKKEKSDTLSSIQRYFNYSPQKAREAIRLLNKKQIDYIVKIMNPEG